MKFVSYIYQKKPSYGVLAGDGVFDLGKKFGKKYPTLRAALVDGALNKLKAAAKGKKPNIKLNKIQFLPVIHDARKIICVGLNYREHRAETGRPDTVHPTLFTRWADSQVGHEQPMLKPPESEKFDWEGELVVIIGKAGRRIPREKAMSHVAGYSCYNEGSVRDWQRHTSQFTPGKNFPATGPLGPWMVTTDVIPDPQKLELTTRLNGNTVQHDTTDHMIFDVATIIEYLSTVTWLEPGDIIATGTPDGVGMGRKPPLWMKGGDRLEVEISGIGKLGVNVVDE